jgi:tetratricopeptide (TPR) repeat protein
MVATDSNAPAAPVRRRRTLTALDALVAVAVAVLLAFPLAAWLAARAQPVAPGPVVRLPALPETGERVRLSELPAGLSSQPLPSASFMERLQSDVSAATTQGGIGISTFPYDNPQLERLLPAQPSPGLGAWLLLQSAAQSAEGMAAPSAAAPAYAVLDRARGQGGCAPQLNLLVLVAADGFATARDVEREAARARQACPGDPTPRWLLGQYRSQTDPASAFGTFRALQREFPLSAVGWSGEGDAYLRLAFEQPPTAVFTARRYYEEALARYRRAARVDPNPELEFGIARALAGLERPAEAARRQERALRTVRATEATLASLVLYLEQAHRHADAARAAARLQRLPSTARGVFPSAIDPFDDDAGAGVPLSLGATLTPLHVTFRVGGGGGGVTVTDTSYIPRVRESPALDGGRWCAEAALRRNLIAAGEPRAALDGMPKAFVPVAGHGEFCSGFGTESTLAGIAWLELGDRRAAREAGAADDMSLAQLEDARQNLWRWAGDLAHAERAARAWNRGSDPAALLRVAEIEYLRGRYDAAARDFGAAAREVRAEHGTWSLTEAAATLERAGALLKAGRRVEALSAFASADEIASRAGARASRADEFDRLSRLDAFLGGQSVPGALALVSYHARAQLADAAREDGNLKAAAEHYRAAREVEHAARESWTPPNVARVANNGAIVSSALGRTSSAGAMTAKAIRTDPLSPVFLTTAAAVAARTARADEAIRRSRAALAADPTTFPAANDLGVLLARAGRHEEAAAALRRAVGANERYALGWFNLGVVLSKMGPLHLPAAQGSLGRAFTLAPALRDRERVPTLDSRTYRSGLDLGRPLPPEWSFASSQRRAPAKTAGLAAILLIALGLGRALSSTKSGREIAETWLGPFLQAIARVPIPAVLRRPAIAAVATLAILLYPLARDPGGGLTAAIAGSAALALLVVVVVRVRAATARRHGDKAAQESWPPGVLFGAGTAVAGLTWTPLPVLREGAKARVHWAAPVVLAVLAIPLVVFTAWLDVPLVRAIATAALVMAASLLTPIKPVDGGAIAAAGGTAAGLTGLGLAALLALGLV